MLVSEAAKDEGASVKNAEEEEKEEELNPFRPSDR